MAKTRSIARGKQTRGTRSGSQRRTSARSQVTTNHATIKRWVEERGGCPSRVKGTRKGKSAGVLRVDYPGYSGQDSLEPISWDEWFATFDESGLAFVYQTGPSRFSKLVSKETVAAKERAKPKARAKSGSATGRRGAVAKRTARPATRKKTATKARSRRAR